MWTSDFGRGDEFGSQARVQDPAGAARGEPTKGIFMTVNTVNIKAWFPTLLSILFLVACGGGGGGGGGGGAASPAPGSLDASFGTNGIVTTPIGSSSIANAVAIQGDGRIV